MASSAGRRADGNIRRPGLRYASLALLIVTAFALAACGPDRRHDFSVNEPLESNPLTFTVSNVSPSAVSAGGTCRTPMILMANHADTITLPDGTLEVNGGMFADAGPLGALQFGRGAFTITQDPNDPTHAINITGDGTALIPFVGDFLSKFNIGGPEVQGTLTLKQGSDLQYLGYPIPDDNHCYFLIQLTAGGSTTQASNGSINFSMGLNTDVVLDPTDPLFYFNGTLSNVPGLPIPISQLDLGFSAQGRLQQQLAAIKDNSGNPITVNANLAFGATIALDSVPLDISGNFYIHWPSPTDTQPEIQMAIEGSLYLDGGPAYEAIKAIDPNFTDSTLHLGDGDNLFTIGLAVNASGHETPNSFLFQFGLKAADILGNLLKAMHPLDDVITAKDVLNVNGALGINPTLFTIEELGEVQVGENAGGVTLSNFDLQQHLLVSSQPVTFTVCGSTTNGSVADFSLCGDIQFGPLVFSIAGAIDPNLNGSGPGFYMTATLGLNLEVAGTGLVIDASLIFGYPAGASASAQVQWCAASSCHTAIAVTIGVADPEICVTVIGITHCYP